MDDEKVLERFNAYLADVRREGGTASQFLNVTLSALSCMCLSKNAVEVYRDNANTLADKRLSEIEDDELMANNRFADFKWTDAQTSQPLTRADILALVDQFSLSLTKRAYALDATDSTAAVILGHIATALQDTRLELYARMQSELTNATADVSVMAVYGDAPTTRTTYKPYNGTGNAQLREIGQRVLRAAIRRAGW